MDYTKYALKSAEELDCMMAGKDNFFVVACNKCFKEFDTTEEPECGGFAAIAAEKGKQEQRGNQPLRLPARLVLPRFFLHHAILPLLGRPYRQPPFSLIISKLSL